MSDTKYQLTEAQQQNLAKFAQIKLADYIDEHLSGEFLITDEMVDNDDWDAINARKSAALEFILNQL
jgi:hypothetical protein